MAINAQNASNWQKSLKTRKTRQKGLKTRVYFYNKWQDFKAKDFAVDVECACLLCFCVADT